jgi:hypothetical protein
MFNAVPRSDISPKDKNGGQAMIPSPGNYETSRVRFIEHKGKSVLLQDYSGMQPGPEFVELIQRARAIIDSQPFHSVLTLVDANNSVFDTEVLVIMKDFVKRNTPYIKYTAVVGITGLKEVGLMALTRVAGRPLQTFSTREEALDYMVGLE